MKGPKRIGRKVMITRDEDEKEQKRTQRDDPRKNNQKTLVQHQLYPITHMYIAYKHAFDREHLPFVHLNGDGCQRLPCQVGLPLIRHLCYAESRSNGRTTLPQVKESNTAKYSFPERLCLRPLGQPPPKSCDLGISSTIVLPFCSRRAL